MRKRNFLSNGFLENKNEQGVSAEFKFSDSEVFQTERTGEIVGEPGKGNI